MIGNEGHVRGRTVDVVADGENGCGKPAWETKRLA